MRKGASPFETPERDDTPVYHLHVDNVNRRSESGGTRSAVAVAAYRAGACLTNSFEDGVSDFTSKSDVLHTEIILPDGAPAWMADREKLWNAVDASEKRKDARLAREVEYALPRDLPNEEWIACTQAFARHFADQGLVVDVAIHEDGTRHNPHVHLLMTTRRIEGNSFGQKNRAINQKTFVIRARETWASIANKSLEAVGSPIRIDPRSNAARGIKEEPTRHRGPDKHERLHRRIERSERMKELPVVSIEHAPLRERDYHRDDTAEEFRAVDDPKERIAFDDPRVRDLVEERSALNTEERGSEEERAGMREQDDREEHELEADLEEPKDHEGRVKKLARDVRERVKDPFHSKRIAAEEAAREDFEAQMERQRAWEEYDPRVRIDLRDAPMWKSREEQQLHEEMARDNPIENDPNWGEEIEQDPEGRPIHRDSLQQAQERMLAEMEREVSDREEREMREERERLEREREER